MARAKRKTLPKDFEDLLVKGDLDALKCVYDLCDVNARGGIFKQTALAFNGCPDGLARWLVEQGADLSAQDRYGETPLHSRAGCWDARLDILLELGADVHHDGNGRGTPLHNAAGIYNCQAVELLLKHGADPHARNDNGQTPLTYALQRCENASISGMACVAEVLLKASASVPAEKPSFLVSIFRSRSATQQHINSEMKAMVTRIGENFEFHRSNFNQELVEETSEALAKLYDLFDVEPVPRRTVHDGKSPIRAKASSFTEKYHELWKLLVPSQGAADTIQGEVIRVSGKLDREIYGNGGANWDREFRKMANAFLKYIANGQPLSDEDMSEAEKIIKEINASDSDTQRMCELAVKWVELNPEPLTLKRPNYDL